MKFTDLSIDNFGALSRFSLPEIAPGLNVVHGPNGSGKTTLLQFVRGVFAGFAEARRRQLIPPVGSGAAGGTIGVEWGSRRLAVIRHSRPDEYETLAINVRQGLSDEGHSLRKHLDSFDDERLSVLFTAGSFDANSVEALITLARHDGLDLTTVSGNEGPLSSRLTHLHSQRALHIREIGEPGLPAALKAHCEAIAAEGLNIHRDAEMRRTQLLRERVAIDEQLAATASEIETLHLDWQALATDLAECENRLWNVTSRTVSDVVYVQESHPPAFNPRLPEVEELDLRIEHLRTALKDLAATRRQVSVETAQSAGSDVPTRDVFVARQREALRVMQMQLQVLGGTVQWLESARTTGACVCSSLEDRLGSVTDELRRQVELSCQELSRQQAAWRLEETRADRTAIDDCETGLNRQLDWLRHRREQLLDASTHPVMSRLAHTVTAERQFCGCPDHTATMRATTPRVVTRRTVMARSDVESPARPDDAARQMKLAAAKSEAWNHWQAAIAHSSALVRQRLVAVREFHSIDVEAALAECERRLNQAREQLATLEARQAELLAIDAEISSVEGEIVRDRSSRVIAEASEHLELLTLGRYRALRTADEGLNLQIIAENGSPYVASALSRGTLFQVALALRVALVDEYARRGLEFPLVLDDVLVDSDEHRLEAAAQLLSSAADRGRQILFLTCQDHLVNMLEDRGAVVHALPGSVRVRRSHAVFIPAAPPVLPQAVPEPQPAPEPLPAVAAESEVAEQFTAPVDSPLDFDSPASFIPSMSSHFAALLAAEGVHTVGQVIEIDREAEAPLMARLSISRQDMATWRAEALLLCSIPGLSRDDAQLLAAIGVHRPQDLSAVTAEALSQRILRFRGSAPHAWHAWMRDRRSWPREEDVANWIRHARTPRLLRPQLLPSMTLPDDDNDEPDDDGPQPSGEQDAATRHRRRRSRSGRPRSSTGPHTRSSGSATASADRSPQYFLTLDSPIVDAPSIGPKTAKMLNRAGVQTVAHLLHRSAGELAQNISDRSITSETILAWQQQSRLMCDLPELRGHDAQLLVACGFTTIESLARTTDADVLVAVAPFARSKAGQRMLRSSSPPERNEIAAWVESASQVYRQRAA